ncbi:phage major capsid protein [Mycobacterium syngnathidarum]|uniref:Major capsid protein n=1 Tax=Mycobacterium syngnathidarum TaxID=1908205 RepID=A0A1Q9WFD4_9MYCO|nr:phage major capsid protein [Mycobacterium syngnathidarum]OHT93181.1 major capsid protein [Mycobacterium syngnathidarum]OLT97399.1 major capsid protein [Mycobacterium syngnathidarum]
MAITTSDAAYPWRPDTTFFPAADVVPDALILQASTIGGEVLGDAPSLRVAYVNDDDATFTAEGQAPADSDPDLSEVVVYTAKIQQNVELSNEQFQQEQTADQLSASVSRAIIKRADQAFIAQTAPTLPAVAPPAGLLNITGIESGTTITDDLDALVDLVAQLESNGSMPTHIIVDPLGWGQLRKLKTATDSNASLLGAGTTDATRLLLDLPVLVNRYATPYSGLVVDSSAVVSAVGTVNIATSEHAAFRADSTVIRATWRIGWNVVRPERIGKFTITEPGS